MKNKIFIAMLITFLSTPAHALFHSNDVAKCNDEAVLNALASASADYVVYAYRGTVPPGADPPGFISVGNSFIRQDSYDKENQKRACSCIAEFKLDKDDYWTNFNISRHAKYEVSYVLTGTSDGDLIAVDNVKFHSVVSEQDTTEPAAAEKAKSEKATAEKAEAEKVAAEKAATEKAEAETAAATEEANQAELLKKQLQEAKELAAQAKAEADRLREEKAQAEAAVQAAKVQQQQQKEARELAEQAKAEADRLREEKAREDQAKAERLRKQKAQAEAAEKRSVREKIFTSKRVKSKALKYNNSTDVWVVEASRGHRIDTDTAEFDFVLQSQDKGCSSKRSSAKWSERSANKLSVRTVTATTRKLDRSCQSETTIRYREYPE